MRNAKDRSRGIDGLKNRSEKCEGPTGGVRRVKELKWEMRRTGAVGGGTNGCLKRIFFFKNQKHQPNIVEITHLCIMHEVHTSLIVMGGPKQSSLVNVIFLSIAKVKAC